MISWLITKIIAPPANNVVQADLDFGENGEDEFSPDAGTAAKAPVSGAASLVIKVKKK